MRITLVADPYLPVPPIGYGGIERIVDLLVRGLVARGHDVTLWAHADSRTAARLRPYGRPPYERFVLPRADYLQLAIGLARHAHGMDIVHGFGEVEPLLPLLALRVAPAVQTYQRPIDPAKVRRAAVIGGKRIRFTAVSSAMCRHLGRGHGQWHTIANAVDTRRFGATPAVPADAPLMFLGRLEAIKGVHHAIEIARRSDRNLVIAGNRVETAEGIAYFQQAILPHLGDRVRYVGTVDDGRKLDWLRAAAALLMPIEWDEPFGIVMIEALSCGTPVIAFDRGAVREVIEPGLTGFVVSGVDEAVGAVARLPKIDRATVRAAAERRFDQEVMCRAYVDLYREVSGNTTG